MSDSENIITFTDQLKKRGLPPPITPTGPHHLAVIWFSNNDYIGTLLSPSELLEALNRGDTFVYDAAIYQAGRQSSEALRAEIDQANTWLSMGLIPNNDDNPDDNEEEEQPTNYQPYTVPNRAIIMCRGRVVVLAECSQRLRQLHWTTYRIESANSLEMAVLILVGEYIKEHDD